MKNASSTLAQRNVMHVIEAARCCYEIYTNSSSYSRHEILSKISYIRQLVSEYDPSTFGGTSLVWVYFIAAAASDTLENRLFFSNRLRDIYDVTRFANIPAGVSMLDDLWQSYPGSAWNDVLPKCSTAFVM